MANTIDDSSIQVHDRKKRKLVNYASSAKLSTIAHRNDKRYPDPDVSDVEFVHGFSPKGSSFSEPEPDEIRYSKQILQKVFPLVTTLNQHQLMEKEIEAKVKGVSVSELQLQDANCEVDDNINCDNCGSYSFDFYRSCACGYDLCLVCCQELRDGQLKGVTCGWKSRIDGSIPCPPKDIGGCNDGTLELKHIMCVNGNVNLLEKAQRVYKINDGYDSSQTCMESNASYLYALSAKDIQPQNMQHFQSHWSKGEPIIVNDVLSTSSGLRWEPMALWRACNRPHAYQVNAINCLDWSEVTLSLNRFCRGYSTGQFIRKGLPLILKLEDWQPSFLYQAKWSSNFVEFINCLPFKDYIDPRNGYLNMAVKLPDMSSKPDMGPKIDIAYGVEEGSEYGDSVTKLHYEKSDTVNVLTHTKNGVITPTNFNKRNMVKQKHDDQHEALVCEAGPQRNDPIKEGALWDIFKRQDAPKLEEYLRNHLTEFRHTSCLSNEQVLHPIHDRTFYLNDKHKRKLKEEFGIEPWTFKQKLGDAVFIPAGCAYQVRNLKSCTKVELNFISLESLDECIRLQKELRILPKNHRAKQQKLNIGKMMIYALNHAVEELSGSIDSNGPTDNLQDQITNMPEILKVAAGDGMHINKHSNGWISDSDDVVPASDHQPATIEDTDSLEETVGLWHGNIVGQPAKELLQAVSHRYPDTFQGIEIRSKPYWLSILKELHVFIRTFLQTSVHALSQHQLTSLEADLNDFEKFGFNLSWARKRLNMVKNLKFGNEPLRLELMDVEESLELTYKELVEANERLEKAWLNYDSAKDARNKKVDQVAQKYGVEYDDVLNNKLGFGMLPGY